MNNTSVPGSAVALPVRAGCITPTIPAIAPVPDDLDDADHEVLHGGIPSRRLGQPEDVARMAAFLASDAAAYINGVDIPIDGGITAVARPTPVALGTLFRRPRR